MRWGVRLDHSFQYWLISGDAIGRVGLAWPSSGQAAGRALLVTGLGWQGRHGRWHFAKVIQTLYKLVMIVRLAVQTIGLVYPFCHIRR